MSILKSFSHSLHLSTIDPLGDGLAEDIAYEQQEADRIDLQEMPDGDALASEWSTIVQDVESEPDWFDFNND